MTQIQVTPIKLNIIAENLYNGQLLLFIDWQNRASSQFQVQHPSREEVGIAWYISVGPQSSD